MRVPIEASISSCKETAFKTAHHPLKMRVPIEAVRVFMYGYLCSWHHPLKMRVPIEAIIRYAFMVYILGGITL